MGTQLPIRTLEATTKEVYVDVNDLLIRLMMMREKESSESERKPYDKIIKLLENMRLEGHKK
jgi:hypothetical protein